MVAQGSVVQTAFAPRSGRSLLMRLLAEGSGGSVEVEL